MTTRSETTIVVLDLETTGLPTHRGADVRDSDNWPHIVQLSWLVFNLDTGFTQIHDHIIRLPEGVKIPKRSTEIHKITNELMQKKGEPLKDHLVELIEDIEQCTYLVAHNLQFDKSVLHAELWRHGIGSALEGLKCLEICTMLYGTKLCNLTVPSKRTGKPMRKFPKLQELHQYLFGSQFENGHNSLVDVLACFRCFYQLFYGKDIIQENRHIADRWQLYCATRTANI